MTLEGFVPLGDRLRQSRALVKPECAPAETLVEPQASAPEPTSEILSFAEEIALLRLRVMESFERSRMRVLRRFAEEVLARELHSAPADIEEIARTALRAFADELPVSLAVSPEDAVGLRADAPVRVDASLRRGDIIVHVADGCFESPLHLRAAHIVRETLREEDAL